MADWTTPANGNWSDAARWTGGVPNAAGATANFIVPNPGNATVLISFSQNASFTVGTLNVTTDSDQGWLFQGEVGVTSATLRFQGAGGGPAVINVDTNNSSRVSSISDANGMKVTLASDLILTTADSATAFEIRAPITGAFDVYKFGSGTLRLSGGNSAMTGDYFLNGGRTELTSANAVGGGSVIKLNNGATLASINTFTLANDLETGSGNASGFIVAKTGTTLTLTGDLLLHSRSGAAITFGSAADAGTIVLSGTNSIAGTGGFNLDSGTLRFGSAAAAANYFAALGPTAAVQVRPGAILDTGGFAATIDNLDLDDGTLQSSGGPLDVTSDERIGNILDGTVVGTGQADRLVFNVSGNIDLNELIFNNWTDGTDTITINGDDGANEIVGSSRNETINGGGGADLLDGRGGINIIRGGTGDDTYFIATAQNTLIENAGEGTDTVIVSNGGPTAFTLAANFENLTFVGPAQHTGIGNTAGNVLTGGSGNDSLQGLEGNDTLVGNGSADTLDGGSGEDTMNGGGGDDIYIVDNAGDVVIDSAGFDLVYTSVNYTLGADLERLGVNGFTTTYDINLTGNGLDNEMWGNDGRNVLDGRAGADIMRGFGGDDIYIVDNAGDLVLDTTGFDTIYTSINYSLGGGIERLGVNGFATTHAINLTGNGLDNEMWGNDGVNVLDGGAGADILNGFGGDDIYIIDNAGDVAVDSSGFDTIYTSVSYTLDSTIERLGVNGFTTTYAINLTGNELANELWGNDGVNVLDGRLGADILRGFGGADTFAFTSALGGGNVDQIVGYQAGVDKIALDDAIFSGLAPGALNPAAFRIGAGAQDADDRIIYDSTTGALYFDADGNGAGAAVQFAALSDHLAITAGDFTVI